MAEEVREYLESCFYSREFKLEAVGISERSDKMVAQSARPLAAPEHVRYRWRHDL